MLLGLALYFVYNLPLSTCTREKSSKSYKTEQKKPHSSAHWKTNDQVVWKCVGMCPFKLLPVATLENLPSIRGIHNSHQKSQEVAYMSNWTSQCGQRKNI